MPLNIIKLLLKVNIKIGIQVQEQLLAQQQTMAGYVQPSQEILYPQPELSAVVQPSMGGESQAFMQQVIYIKR